MAHRIFFSWQSDTPARGGRNFVERALQDAVKAIGADASVEPAERPEITLESGTIGEPGFPPITETIFKRIDAAAIFVADFTFAGTRRDGRPIPNSNVLIEYGRALRPPLEHLRILPIMNTAFGGPDEHLLPFDLSHLRHPITYYCADDATDQQRRSERNSLSKSLARAIQSILDSGEFKKSLPKPVEPQNFGAQEPLEGHGRFRIRGKPIGLNDRRSLLTGSASDVFLQDGPVMWLRVMPRYEIGRRWSVGELRTALSTNSLMPIMQASGDYGRVRGPDGCGMYGIAAGQDNRALDLAYIFVTGEIWSVDAWLLNLDARAQRERSIVLPHEYEKSIVMALRNYVSFLSHLEIEPPYRWIAGMEDTVSRTFTIPRQHGGTPIRTDGICVEEHIEVEGVCSSAEDAQRSIRAFFHKIYDSCGVERPDWLDQY